MAKELRLRRGTTAQHSTFTGANGEVTVDTTKKTVVVHDGATAGGVPLATEAAVNAKQNADAELTTLAGMSADRAAFLAGTQGFGFRNRIINGDMRIDQRNNGAQLTPTSAVYGLDRWYNVISQSSKYSIQRSTVAPVGFTNSMLATSLSAYTVGASDFFALTQYVEGFNGADLGWGTANAQAVTLSFRVRSSLTGTFVVAIRSGIDDAAYPATYTISAANTWETKTITIPGPTSGTFATDNSRCFGVWFSLGMGSSLQGTANTWAGGGALGVSGAVNMVSTNGATFYITGVQLEAGSVATPFERRDYGRELIMCQRYFWQIGGSTNSYQIRGAGVSGGAISQTLTFPVAMRSAPTVTIGSVIYANGNGLAFNTNVQQATMGFNTTAAGVDCYVTASGTGFTTFSSEL